MTPPDDDRAARERARKAKNQADRRARQAAEGWALVRAWVPAARAAELRAIAAGMAGEPQKEEEKG